MNLNELTHLLAVLGPIFGVASTVLGVLVWVLKSHIQSKNEQIEQLKKDEDDLKKQMKAQEGDYETQLAQADARYQKLQASHELVSHELVQLKASVSPLQTQAQELQKKLDDALAEQRRYYAVALQERNVRKEAEKRESDLITKVRHLEAEQAEILSQRETAKRVAAEAVAAKESAEAEREKAAAEKEKIHQRASGYREKTKQLQAQLEGILKQDGRVWRKSVPPDVPPFLPLAERKTPIISILNLKGGVGKTTITANLAGYLCGTVGKRVLVIDADHQRSLSQLFLSDADRKSAAADGHTIQHFLTSATRDGNALVDTAGAIPNLDNCWIITNTDPKPGAGIDQGLDDLEMRLMGQWLTTPGMADVRFLMRSALQSDIVRGKYDFVLLDCPPRLTTVCINALTASDFVIIPVQAEAVSIRSVQHLLTRLKELREAEVLKHLRVLGLLANMVSSKAVEKSSHEAKLLNTATAAAHQFWGLPVRLFNTKLTREIRYAEATRELDDDRDLKLAVGYPTVRRQYQELMKEIEERINESIGVAGVPS